MVFTLFIFFIANFLIFINLDKISKFVNLYDIPDKKLKTHKNNTPLIGGSILIFNIFLLLIIDLILKVQLFDFFLSFKEKFIFLFMLFSYFLLGFYDDKFNINPNKKFFLLIFITTVFVILDENLVIQKFSLSFYDYKIFLGKYSIFFSIFCFVILINALNFYDGINGQSLIFYLLVFLYLFFVTERVQLYGIILIILTFLLFLNLSNRLFLGDNGIYVMGLFLSVSLIYEHNVYKNILFADEIFMLLLLPGFDLLRLTIFRLLKGKNPFYGDRNHIHHLLIKRYSLLNTNLILLILGVTPIVFFKILKLNFFLIIPIFVIIYCLAIFKIKKI
tara:strand:+ start:3574 stop:4572 length:999 start_codon:yes stop_codon:yes gene_type:complete